MLVHLEPMPFSSLASLQPITALHSFRDNKANLLLATPAAARGLDLPAVSHVNNVAPLKDATEYLHRAGRAGRIGSPVPAVQSQDAWLLGWLPPAETQPGPRCGAMQRRCCTTCSLFPPAMPHLKIQYCMLTNEHVSFG